MEETSAIRWGWIIAVLLVIGSAALATWRLDGLPSMAIFVGPDMQVRSATTEAEPGHEMQAPVQRGDRLVAIGGQSVADLGDLRAVAASLPEPSGPELSASTEYRVVRPMHRFTLTLTGLEVDPTALPPGVEATDELVEVDGRPLPGKVGVEGLRSIMSSRPEALLGFERQNAVFSGRMTLGYSTIRYAFLVSFLLAFLCILALWRFGHSRLHPATPVAVAMETVCFAWVTLLGLQYQWVLSDPWLASAIVGGMVLVRPVAFLARAKSSEDDTGAGAWTAIGLAVLAAAAIVGLMLAGLLESLEQGLHLSAVVGLLYIVYEIVAGLARGGRTTFGERSGYLAGIILLSMLAGFFAYFSDPHAFLEDRWLWFAVIIVALVWFGDVLYCVRGPATGGVSEIAGSAGRQEVVASYLARLAEEMPQNEVVLVVFREEEAITLRRLGPGDVLIAPAEPALHDALSILVQEGARVPLPDTQDRLAHPMAGIAQTMHMSMALNLAPPSGAIEVPDVALVVVAFHVERAGELPAYASTETLTLAQTELSALTWTAALVEAMQRFGVVERPPRDDREKRALQEQVSTLEGELEAARDDIEGLRDDRSGLASQVQNLARQVEVALAPGVSGYEELLEAELVQALDYLLETDEPVVLGGPLGAGKSFVACVAHRLDERFAGPVAVFDALEAAASTRGGEVPAIPEGTLEAVLGGALIVRGAQLLDDTRLLALARRATSRFRLFLCFEDRHAEERSVLERRSGDVRQLLEHREIIIPAFAHRPAIQQAVLAHYLDRAALAQRKEIVGFSAEAARALEAYDYPGNVEEVRVLMKAAVALAPGEVVDVEDLPFVGEK